MKAIMRDKSELKGSGIEWIGDIPYDWNISRIGNFFCFRSGDTLTNEQIKDEEKYPVYGANGCRGYYDQYNLNGKYILLGRVGALCGNVHIVNESVWVTEHALIAEMKKEITHEVYAYIFDSMNLIQYSKASAQPVISSSTLMGLRIPIIPQKEQQVIRDYLDDRCSKIDAIIAEAKASIEEYKELKQAVIYEAVTKGLDKTVDMKIYNDWFDKCPSNWEYKQIRYLYELRDERNFKPLSEVNLISLYTDQGVIQHADIEKTSGNKAVTADGYKKVYPEDIVVNIILCWMGAMGRSEYEGVTSPAYDVYKPIGCSKVCSRYYHYLFRTDRFSKKCYTVGRGIMMMRWRTYSSQFRAIKVPVPPYNEQIEIANYLDKRISNMEELINAKQSLIKDLEAYKKSLIYEVVTGKRKVVA